MALIYLIIIKFYLFTEFSVVFGGDALGNGNNELVIVVLVLFIHAQKKTRTILPSSRPWRPVRD